MMITNLDVLLDAVAGGAVAGTKKDVVTLK
jgi:hypothetical protein